MASASGMSAGCRRRRRVADTSAPTLQSTNQNTNDSTVIVFGNATTPLDPHEIHTQSVTDTTLEFWKTSWSKFLQTLTCTSTATHADADDEKSVFDVNVQERISQRTVQRQKKLSLHALVLMERSHAHRGAGRSRQGLRRGLPLSPEHFQSLPVQATVNFHPVMVPAACLEGLVLLGSIPCEIYRGKLRKAIAPLSRPLPCARSVGPSHPEAVTLVHICSEPPWPSQLAEEGESRIFVDLSRFLLSHHNSCSSVHDATSSAASTGFSSDLAEPRPLSTTTITYHLFALLQRATCPPGHPGNHLADVLFLLVSERVLHTTEFALQRTGAIFYHAPIGVLQHHRPVHQPSATSEVSCVDDTVFFVGDPAPQVQSIFASSMSLIDGVYFAWLSTAGRCAKAFVSRDHLSFRTRSFAICAWFPRWRDAGGHIQSFRARSRLRHVAARFRSKSD